MSNINTVNKLAQDLLRKLGIEAEVSAEALENMPPREGDEEGKPLEHILVNVEGDDLGALIGHHGDTLNSLGHVLSLMASHETGEPVKVTVDAGNWRQNRQEQLESMAKRALDQVRRSGREYDFPPMNAAERRIIHMVLSEEGDVVSESEGEGRDRHIILRSKH